jgi:hypothetical protein
MFMPLLYFIILCPFSLLLSVLSVERNRGLTPRKTLSITMQRRAAPSHPATRGGKIQMYRLIVRVVPIKAS